MSRVTVFGGTGFIGRSLVPQLVTAGHSVKVVSRRATPVDTLSGITMAAGDMADHRSIETAVEGSDVVVLLVTGGGDRWADFVRDVVHGTQAVAEACARSGVKRLVYTSSIAALYLGASKTVTEMDGVDPRPDRRSFYSRAKIEAEAVVRRSGVPWVILRPALVMGRGGVLNHAGLGLWPSDTCCVGWGDGRNPLPFVLVDDVATALRAAVDAPVEGGMFNLAGDVSMSAREFIEAARRASRRPFRFYSMHAARMQALDLVKWVVKVAARKPENEFPSYRDLRSNGLRAQLDCSQAKQRLGWKPNADRELFLQEALLSHIAPIPAGDLRRAPSAS